MPNPALSNIVAQARSLVGQDPRKLAILATLLALLGLLIFRQVMNSTATAQAGGGRVGGETLVSERPDATGTSESTISAQRSNSESPVARWLANAPAPLSRNLFAVKLDLFPLDVTKSHSPEESSGFWDEVAKSLLNHADQQERKQELLSSLQEQAKALRVTSVLMGPKPRAVINGELVGEGDVVASFRVLEIEPRRIVIEREGIRLEITMN